MTQISKRREFLINQGYSREAIEFFESCGVNKHLLWFLKEFKTFDFPSLKKHTEDIKVINSHIEENGKNKFKSLADAFNSAYSELTKKKSLEKISLYKFADGHFITAIPHSDLHGEGVAMSNCVGNYVPGVQSKERAILALKSSVGETLVHFEVMKNGMISQNYEKANMPVRGKYWKYICEFLKKNSKNIDSRKHFGFGWEVGVTRQRHNDEGFTISANCVIPRKVSQSISKEGKVVTKIEDSESLKRFETVIPSIKFSGLDKSELLDTLRNVKSEMVKSMDNLISNVEVTDGENLFISDHMKEKIFGKDCYLMKGNDYNFFDMTMFNSRIVENVPVPEAPHQEMAEMRDEPRRNEQRRDEPRAAMMEVEEAEAGERPIDVVGDALYDDDMDVAERQVEARNPNEHIADRVRREGDIIGERWVNAEREQVNNNGM